jgi:hypothetical protein
MQLSALFFLGLATGGALADSGYAASCNTEKVSQPGAANHGCPDNVLFMANCEQTDGVYLLDTTIDLNHCFANAGGVLQGQL